MHICTKLGIGCFASVVLMLAWFEVWMRIRRRSLKQQLVQEFTPRILGGYYDNAKFEDVMLDMQFRAAELTAKK